LETREKFPKRGIIIKSLIDSLAKKNPFLFSISVEEELVDWDEFRKNVAIQFLRFMRLNILYWTSMEILLMLMDI